MAKSKLQKFVEETHYRVGKEHARKGESRHSDGMIESVYNEGYDKGIKEHEHPYWGEKK